MHIHCSFLPANLGHDVREAQKDMTKELREGDIFWAVKEDLVHDLFQGGFQPHHRRSILVGLDVDQAPPAIATKVVWVPFDPLCSIGAGSCCRQARL